MPQPADRQNPPGLVFVFVATALAAFAARMVFAWFAPAISPDGGVYLTVADNIRLNGCISVSQAAGGACVPHWGGNHPPGYPILLWLAWLPFGRSELAGLIAQSLVFALAAGWMARAAALYSGRQWIGLAAGLLSALSPVHVAWARYILPETLAVAATIWLFAEFMLSLVEKRLRLVPIGLALTAAFFARYDGILLVAPVVLCAFLIHRPVQALRRGLVVALVFAIPVAVWSGRNVARGLSFVPDPFFQNGAPRPSGYLAWGNTWITTIYQGGRFAYPLQSRTYERIRIDPVAYDSVEERVRVEALLARLTAADGKPFPAAIDAEFAEIAAARRANLFRQWAVLPVRRMAHFWLNPFQSFGWPVEINANLSAGQREALARGGAGGILGVALQHPLKAAIKAGLAGYRYLLVTLAVVAGGLIAVGRLGRSDPFFWLVALYAVVRTLALSLQLSVDSRYMIEAMAPLEIAVMIAVASLIAGRRRTSAPSS